jgi:glycerol-3-phosphate acyltransferase PlsX
MTARFDGRTTPSPGVGPGDDSAEQAVVVALDLFGGDAGPEVVADAAHAVLNGGPGIDLLLVGPADVAATLLAARGLSDRVGVVPADDHVRMDEEAVPAVRARPGVSVRVAADLVRDRRAHATVSVGHTGAALAAATFSLGRLPGITRAAVAVVVPALAHDVVLLDAGGTPDATPELLGQFARSGSAFATAMGLGDSPRVGLLTIGTESGKGDALRRSTDELLRRLELNYVGGVEGQDVALGGPADVVVTDGFTGNVVLKALEGAVDFAAARIGEAYPDAGPARRVVRELAIGSHGGAVLLGVEGVSVVGHGSSDADEIAACVRLAARAARHDLVARTAAALRGSEGRAATEPTNLTAVER